MATKASEREKTDQVAPDAPPTTDGPLLDLTDQAEDPTSVSDGFTAIRHRLGVAYDDDCVSVGLTWRRDYQDTGDARRGNTFLLRLAFRNLGV